MNSYHSEPQQRLMKAVEALVGREASGLSTGEIARAIGQSASAVTRCLANLQANRWVEVHPRHPGRYRLTATFSQIANTINFNLTQAQQQMSLDVQNYSKLI
ncbi:MarR family transcriptional regulator [Bowmanella denitrificans]|uniref:MarR family transcriptional regulator n=1 Tax=Bowmanella denitrificans TaxID=366582 RepID=UPI000C9B3722|nr:MarR family transcriptional regulator [Bowmanella denitrificans]